MKHKPIEERLASFAGTQDLYRFPNDYGASVVRSAFSYGGSKGKFELAVIKWKGDDWDVTYQTPITSDVIGYLSKDEVQELLTKISKLKA